MVLLLCFGTNAPQVDPFTVGRKRLQVFKGFGAKIKRKKSVACAELTWALNCWPRGLRHRSLISFPLSLSPAHELTHLVIFFLPPTTHTHTRTHTHTHAHTHTTYVDRHVHSHARNIALSLSLTHTHTHTLNLSTLFYLLHFIPILLFLSLSHTHTHTPPYLLLRFSFHS